VFRGLIEKADHADEVAGVIAHEIGHIAHRDGTKAVLQAGGLSFLFGMLLGDFVGGGAVVVAAKTVLQSSYSREAEAGADAYGAELMSKAHGNARALATMLAKIGGATEPGMKILLDHPETQARIAAINKLAGARPTTPFLDAGEWAALKRICAG
jgi:Zn-dependent protease with chaperone function